MAEFATRNARRRLLAAMLGSLAASSIPLALRAAGFVVTPRQSYGPFYPNTLPLDNDNDLVTVAGQPRPARGVVTHIAGRVLDERGAPRSGATVQIWQCNAFGRYHHPRDPRDAPLDPGFQGTGHFVTDAAGWYRFRTIKPVPYPGRAPHIHFEIRGPGFEPVATQMYVAGEPENRSDALLNHVRDPVARNSLIVALEARSGELFGQFDIVLERHHALPV